jgi:SAM-dependent methyltransferase
MPSRLGRSKYTHVGNSTDYMALAIDIIDGDGEGLDTLDIPAGNGHVVEELLKRGHQAVGGDINDAHEYFVRVDMESRLPFDDDSFDAISCLEGIEHVLDEVELVREFLRILRPGGLLVISTPNVMNMYSRLHYFLRGYPYQFPPGACRLLTGTEAIDRGHVNPLSYVRLRYILESLGADIVGITGDRSKKKWLFPLLMPVAWLGRLLARKDLEAAPTERSRMQSIRRDLDSRAIRRARSLVLTARKSNPS